MDLKIGNGLRCCYSTEYSLKCRVMCPRCIQYIYISKYETANRYSVCYALRYVLDLCALYIYKEEAVEGCFFNIPFQRLIPKSNE